MMSKLPYLLLLLLGLEHQLDRRGRTLGQQLRVRAGGCEEHRVRDVFLEVDLQADRLALPLDHLGEIKLPEVRRSTQIKIK